jgi:hypothetical protein
MRGKMNRYGTFFKASWPIQKSHILLTQTNEKTCTFLTDVKKKYYKPKEICLMHQINVYDVINEEIIY